jgi:hypothetical protein
MRVRSPGCAKSSTARDRPVSTHLLRAFDVLHGLEMRRLELLMAALQDLEFLLGLVAEDRVTEHESEVARLRQELDRERSTGVDVRTRADPCSG